MSKVYIYSNSSDNRNLDKNISALSSFDCDIMSGTSATEPTLILNDSRINDYLHANYCYIELFKRYYYIEEFVMLKNGQVSIKCKVDVLFTYRNYIRALKCLVSRQEYKYNDYIRDNYVVSRVGTKTDKKKVGSLGNDISYVMTVTGGSE